jgi:hypothetical protein
VGQIHQSRIAGGGQVLDRIHARLDACDLDRSRSTQRHIVIVAFIINIV